MNEQKTKSYNRKLKSRDTEFGNYGSTDIRNHGMTEEDKMESWSDGNTERQKTIRNSDTRKFVNPVKPLMSEAEKADAQVLELSYDFSCRIIR